MPSGTMRSGCRWYHSSNSQSFHARTHASAELAVGDAEEHATAEPGDLRREVHRRPHAVDVHVAHAGVDVVATGAHLVEAERLELHRLRAPARPPRSSRPGCSARPRTPRPGDPCASRRSSAPAPGARRGADPRTCAAARRRGRRPRSPCTSRLAGPAPEGTAHPRPPMASLRSRRVFALVGRRHRAHFPRRMDVSSEKRYALPEMCGPSRAVQND